MTISAQPPERAATTGVPANDLREAGRLYATGGNAAIYYGLGVTEQNELPALARGEGLWKIGQRAFVVRHLCTPGELEVFDTNARMTANPTEFAAIRAKNAGTRG